MKRKFTEANVKSFLQLCNDSGVQVVIDGGWGIDALLGKQTREHADLDIAIDHDTMPKLKAALETAGFTHEAAPDTRDSNFKMAHQDGRQIDFHTYRFNEKGENIYGIEYIPEHLSGHGIIGGLKVRCIEEHWRVTFYTWYPPNEKGYHDVKLLCAKYNIPMPEQYEKFKGME